MIEPLVTIAGLSEAYRTRNRLGFRRRGREHWALRDVDLEVPRSHVLGIIGSNGSGKTTLLQVVAGVLPPTKGTVTVRGRVGSLVDLSAGFHRDLTGRENLMIGGVLLGMSKAEVRDRLAEIVAFSGLDTEVLDWPLAAYSAGMGLRLGFSLIVHTRPDVLLVDEVLAVGDDAFQRQCTDRVEALRDDGTAVMLVSHDLELIVRTCDTVLVLAAGAPVFLGDPVAAVAHHLAAPAEESRDVPPSERAMYESSWRVQADASASRGVMAALGVREMVRRRELLLVLVERQIRLRAKRSIVGVVWPIVAPLFLLALYAFVFGRVFDIPVADYPAYLFAGLLPWTFLVQTVHDGLQSISFEPDLVRRAPFPYVFLPLARVVVMAGPFVLLLVAFVVWRAAVGELEVAILPLVLLPLVSVVLLVSTITMLLAMIDVFNRDIRYVLNNLFTVWFFLAPIVYTQRMTEEHLVWLERVDPMAWVIDQFRDLLYWGRSPGPAALIGLPLVSVAVFLAGLVVFRRTTTGLAKYV